MSIRVLIFGGTGMLGHKLWQVISEQVEAFFTFRENAYCENFADILDRNYAMSYVQTQDFDSVLTAFAMIHPTVVVNCIGIVKQLPSAHDALASISINSLFPHRLAELCRAAGAKLITISTDCVFSGLRGNYSETDIPDAEDLYGRTKLLGEVDGEGCLTLRTSMIGRQLRNNYGLLEWFLQQQNPSVKGYKKVRFSGLTTEALSRVILELITSHQHLSGIWHVAAEPINKFDLLMMIKQYYHVDVDIEEDESVICDRTLIGGKFRQATGISIPSWPDMINQLSKDPTPYPKFRKVNAM